MSKFIEIVGEPLIAWFEENGPVIVETLKIEASNIAKQVTEHIKNFLKELTSASQPANVHVLEVNSLNQEELVNISKKYIVNDSKEVVVIRKTLKDCYILYLAYSVNKELLPQEKNNYIVIKTNALTPEVLNLFGSEDLIILK